MRRSPEKMKNGEKENIKPKEEKKPRITKKELEEFVEKEMANRKKVNQEMADLGWSEAKERLEDKKQEERVRKELRKHILETHDLVSKEK